MSLHRQCGSWTSLQVRFCVSALIPDAMLRRMDVMSVIRTLAHVRGTRKMGGILVRAAMEDSQWSQYLHLVQKVCLNSCSLTVA
jgi:hypothetical protein